MLKLLAALAAIILAFIWLAPEPDAIPTTSTATIALPEPKQNTSSEQPIPYADSYQLLPRAQIDFTARLLGKEYYRFDRGADISPMDLGLGWGPMANPSLLNELHIWQSGRWIRWRTDKQPPIPISQINQHMANVHIIPADEQIKDQLDKLNPGQMIQLSGTLVDVRGNDGFRWNTSLSRTDTGDGACEVLLATHVTTVPDPYR